MPGSVESFNELSDVPEVLQPLRVIRPLTAGPGRSSAHRNSLSLAVEMKRPASALGQMKDSSLLTERPQSAAAYNSRPTSAWKNRERIKQKLDRRRRLTIGQFADLEKNNQLVYEKHMSEDTQDILAKCLETLSNKKKNKKMMT